VFGLKQSADLLFQQCHPSEAVALYSSALALYGTLVCPPVTSVVPLLLNRAAALSRCGRPVDAAADATRVIALCPDDPFTLYRLSEVHFYGQDLGAALIAAEAGLRLCNQKKHSGLVPSTSPRLSPALCETGFDMIGLLHDAVRKCKRHMAALESGQPLGIGDDETIDDCDFDSQLKAKTKRVICRPPASSINWLMDPDGVHLQVQRGIPTSAVPSVNSMASQTITDSVPALPSQNDGRSTGDRADSERRVLIPQCSCFPLLFSRRR
jgi:hypothetical protein